MGERNTDKTRKQGVEFGALAALIDDYSYPATSTTLIDEYGEQEVVLPDGTQTLADLFEPLQGEVFDSAADARQAVLNMVDDRAIGRKGYSDRTPPAPGETTEWDPKSM